MKIFDLFLTNCHFNWTITMHALIKSYQDPLFFDHPNLRWYMYCYNRVSQRSNRLNAQNNTIYLILY